MELIKYLFRYLFLGAGKNKLLFLAALGLILSSCALLVLQSTMGGLQKNLINLSQKITGLGTIFLPSGDKDTINSISAYLKQNDIEHFKEFELEVLVQNKNYLSPVVLHGFDKSHPPKFLDDVDKSGLILGTDLSFRLKTGYESKVTIISPSHIDPLLGNIPRFLTDYVKDIIVSDVPDIDSYHGWVRVGVLHNLIRDRQFNTIRFFSYNKKIFNDLISKFPDIKIKFWKDLNPTLNRALNLETTMMLFLFTVMTLLVSLSITSGVMIFMEKVNNDLIGMWILGTRPDSLRKSSRLFLVFLNIICVSVGIIIGLVLLLALKNYGGDIMPDLFIDQKIPVYITSSGILISFFVPLFISIIFSLYAITNFRTDGQVFLEKIRTIG